MHKIERLLSYNLVQSDRNVNGTYEEVYMFKTESAEMLGYVDGIADKSILNNDFHGDIEYFNMSHIFTKEKYPEMYLNDVDNIFSVSLVSIESDNLNRQIISRVYGY